MLANLNEYFRQNSWGNAEFSTKYFNYNRVHFYVNKVTMLSLSAGTIFKKCPAVKILRVIK